MACEHAGFEKPILACLFRTFRHAAKAVAVRRAEVQLGVVVRFGARQRLRDGPSLQFRMLGVGPYRATGTDLGFARDHHIVHAQFR